MSLTLATARTELRARGGEFLYDGTTTRLDYYLNRSYQELCAAEDWPFLEASASGAAPLTISDLRSLESVTDTVQSVKLEPLSRPNITDWYPDTTTAGTPAFYYLTSGTTVNVYPTATNSITVKYWKVPADLVNVGDVPLIPGRFHMGIIDGAMAFAYLDSDNFNSAQQMFAVWEGTKEAMREQLLIQAHDRPGEYIVLGWQS